MDKQRMFCFQCQETARGTGCTVKGVCGKEPQTAMYMDMLLAAVRAVGFLSDCMLSQSDKEYSLGDVGKFITDALFATITNANFADDSIKERIAEGLRLRDVLMKEARESGVDLPDYPELHFICAGDSCIGDIQQLGVLRYGNDDIRSLKELVMYGLKGMAAYYDHAARLGYEDRDVIVFMCRALSLLTNPEVDDVQLINLVLETGKAGLQVMDLLDKANTAAYGNPKITEVNIGVRCNPGILISGHDLHDIEELLKQTEGTGIDVYTHGEMLPAHYYPKLKRFKHLAGNYGNAWWQQREEFEHFHGPIVFTSNCIVPPRMGCSYGEKVFVLNSTGYPGWKYIEVDAEGHKDFSEVIAIAKTCSPPDEIEHGCITGGFAHTQVLSLIDSIVSAVKSGAIKRFVVMSGCDGRMKSREYYTEFAKALPADTVILTSGCAKFRYIKLGLGSVGCIPRVLDAGQCNDSYSWVLVAQRLKDVFKANDINDLPISFNIAWYEQKAVIVLLALLSLGIKHIHLGPTMPAFVSPSVLKVLKEKFDIGGITDVESDIQTIACKE